MVAFADEDGLSKTLKEVSEIIRKIADDQKKKVQELRTANEFIGEGKYEKVASSDDVKAQPIGGYPYKIYEISGLGTMENRLEMIIDNIRSDFVRLLNDHEMNAERFLSHIERAIKVSRRYI